MGWIMKYVLAFLLPLFVVPGFSQDSPRPGKDVCLEKEVSDVTRLIFADGEKLKIGFLVEHFTGADGFRQTAIEVIRTQFSNKFAAEPDRTLGMPYLYISGTPVTPDGSQFVDIKLQIEDGILLLPESGNTYNDLHLAKIGDPSRSISGHFVFAEEGRLLPAVPSGPLGQVVWNEGRTLQLREMVQKVLSEFSTDWEKAGNK
jgi:hypothetical protein